jgi:hypothetical protein
MAGLLALRGQDDEKAARRFLLFLLVVYATMSPPDAPYRPLSFRLPTLLSLAILGILVLILLNLKRLAGMSTRNRVAAVLLGLAMVVLFGLLWNSRLGVGLGYLILPGALVLALGWALGSRYGWLALTLSLLSLGYNIHYPV